MTSNLVYRASSGRQDSPNEAVVVHCGDHRFQQGFREFLSQGLGLKSYAPLVIPGGGHFTSLEQLQPKFAKVGMQSLKFLVKRTGARRIVLIGHDDCLFFKDHLQFSIPGADLNRKQVASLRRCVQVLAESFPRADVELYFADADPAGSLEFLKIPAATINL